MDIGLNINNKVKVKLGESLDTITNKLDEEEVNYKIPFKGNNEAEQSIIILLEKYGVELTISDNKVVYIKSTDYGANILVAISLNDSPVEMLNIIRESLSASIGVDERHIAIESFDMAKLNTVFRIKVGELNVKISIVCVRNNMYIHTVGIVYK